MTPALTDTVPQEPGVHFSPSLGIKSLSADINVCVDNSKASSSSIAYCDPTLCLQEDFIGLQLEESLSSTHYQTIFLMSNSDMNVQDSNSVPLKTEKDSYRQRLHAKHDAHERRVKRELFPGTVSKVLADVNKLWDISVTEDEGVHRLSGRIDGQSLAMPFASDCTLPDLRCISPMENKLQKAADAKVLHLRYLNRQQALLSRAQRSWKRLQLLLARYTVDHCSQQVSGLVKRKIEQLNIHQNSSTRSCPGVQSQPDVVVGLIESAGFRDKATLESSTAIKKFSLPAAGVLRCIQQELDSDVTESSSDEDWEEKPKNAHDCSAEWSWLSGRADVGSRWNWLQAQIAELECKIHQLADLHSQLRSKKGTLVFQECSNCILGEDTHLPYPGTSLRPTGTLPTPPEEKNLPPATDLEMSPSSPTLLLRNIEKQSAQLTEMVSSLITAFPVSLSPTSPDKLHTNGKMTAGVPHGASKLQKAGMTTRNRFCKQQLVRKRKRIRIKASSTLRSSSARTRPLLLFHKRNLYRMFLGYTPLHLDHKPVYGSNKSWHPVNYSSIGLSCDKPQKPVLVQRDVCEIDPSFHPILSLPSDLLLRLHLEGLLKRKSDIKDPLNSRFFYPHDDDEDEDDDEHLPHGPVKCWKRCILSPGPQLVLETPNREGRLGNMNKTEIRPSHAVPADDLDVTPISQKTSFQLQSRDRNIVLNAARRRVRSENSYDIDNIVIPMNLVAPSKLEKIQYKEILTPSWKEVALEPLKSPLCEELEDLADEAFLIRHQKYEQIEKVRWSFWEQRKCPKRSRSSSHSSGQCPGNVFSGTEENYSPNSMSPVSWDTPPLNGWASQNLQFTGEFQQVKANHWEPRIFPLTEEAAVALNHLSSPFATPLTPTPEDKVVEPLHSSCDKENR
ncbi:KAT8 regulatory NSL complex subunit 1-like protein isoform X2 [Phyllobates terribilis]|uniref:KAT8 regulatory NSL complex subunit 1-like protein isoform X2 n=1 Tax=Phyllobates terribilis TaxID=111132 RepID=UPI003CCAD745